MIITCPECATRCLVENDAIGDVGRRVTCGACGADWYQLAPTGPASRSRPFNHALADDAVELPIPPSRDESRADRRRERVEETATPRLIAPRTRTAMVRTDVAAGPDPRLRGRATRRSDRANGRRMQRAATVLASAAVGALLAAIATAPRPSAATDPSGVDGLGAWIETFSAPEATPVWSPSAPEGAVFVAHGYDVVELPEGPALEVWGRIANNGPDEIVAPLIDIVSRDATETALQRWSARPERRVLAPGEDARFSSRMMFPLGPVSAVDLSLRSR